MRLAFLFALSACGDNLVLPDAPGTRVVAQCSEGELATQLASMPNVTAVRSAPCGKYVGGTAQCFNITIAQPIDHDAAVGRTFGQQVWLAHRGCDRPTVVADWGYSQTLFFDDELAVLFDANTLWIEHRYQGASAPAPADWDWSALTIANGAADMHAVIDSFKHVYGGRWVSTGASKGGITATYHSYLYRDDLDGAVPYVAPASRGRIDPLYQWNFDTTFTQECAQRVRDAQIAALTTRREMMLAHLTSISGPGLEPTYLELMSASFDWAFWQYYGTRYCSQVPTAQTPDEAFWSFYSQFSGILNPSPAAEPISDGALEYEWLTEQGFALEIGAHVAPLLHDPYVKETMEEHFRDDFPDVTLPAYDGALTRSVRKWVGEHAENMLFIYGQYDPWSGGALDEPTRRTSARFFVPSANHGASISGLGLAEQKRALAIAAGFFGEPPQVSRMARAQQAASTRELLAQKLVHQLLFVR